MPKIKNNKKPSKTIKKDTKKVKEDVKKVEGEEDVEKESGTLSDGVLDAFDEVAPVVDPLLLGDEEEVALTEDDEEDEGELDSGDFKPGEDW